jgi:hypothetical protein
MLRGATKCLKVFEVIEEETIQVKVKMALINKIRSLKPEYKEIPAVYLVDQVLRLFIGDLESNLFVVGEQKSKEA